jgi:uncharacterized protein YkwD
MLFRRIATAAAVLASALATAPAHAAVAQPTCAAATAMPTDTDAAADAVTCLVNQQRRQRSLHAVSRVAKLDDAAHTHSADMVRHDLFSHTGSDGSDMRDRFHEAGWGRDGQWRAGEALGWGTESLATPQALVNAWLNSPPHRRILLDPGFDLLGVGVVRGAPIAGKPAADSATYTLDFFEWTD